MSSNEHLRLGNYEPILQLATGGMATVYVARQIGAAGFERLVVLKRVHRHLLSNHEFYDMFRDEARVASLVRHPNVAPVVDVVEAEGELFLVQEYVESSALSTLWKAAKDAGKPLPPAVASRIIADTLAGLHAAHEAVDMRGNRLEVVHRDVSPQNIVVGIDGGSRLIDFGVAKARHRITETKSGSLKGKYGYMSPEQTKAMPLDRRADLFSVGVVLHEVLTGRRLFQGENEFDTLRRISEGTVPDPSSIVPGLPAAVDAVVQKALERDRVRRFQTAAEFLVALEAALPPAPPRDVTAVLEVHCGERLSERRDTLRAVLEGRVPPLDPRTSERLTLPSSPSALRRPSEGTEGQIASTQDARRPMPPEAPRSRRALVVGVAASLALIIAAVALYAASDSNKTTTAGASSTAPAKVAPTSASVAATATEPAPAQAKPEGVTLTLRADSAIESVRAGGTRSIELHGKEATLVVDPWTGALSIDAQLVGGRAVHADALAGGSRDVRLAPPKSTPSAKPRAPNVPAQAPTHELQSNPYGQP